MSDKIKTLSQAIRIGSTFRPQCTDLFFSEADNATCAIGAAIEAIYGEDALFDAPRHVGHLKQRFGVNQNTLHEVFRRNDLGATREVIAIWLESKGL